jgi:hypothetical protein
MTKLKVHMKVRNGGRVSPTGPVTFRLGTLNFLEDFTL